MFDRETVRGLAAYFSSLVHESVRGDSAAAARQQTFIALHVLSGLAALCVFPVYLVIIGKPSLASAIVFLWLLSPIAVAIFLSRTGRFATARVLSAANFAGLITYCAWLTGGVASWLIPWIVVVLFAVALTIMIQHAHKRPGNAVPAGEEHYRFLADNVGDMITRHDEKGRVVFASLGAQHLFGEPAQKILGDGLFKRVHVADRPAYLTALSRCQAANEPTAVEFRVRRAAGPEPARYIWAEMRCQPMRSADAAAPDRCSIVAVTRDISDRKAHEAELVRTRDEAENANRIKTQFLANMSHELRTPLTAIMGFSEILNRELFGTLGEQRYRDYAHLIHESGEHLLNVVNDILDMSKIETGKFKIVKEPFDVASLVTSCCDLMRHIAEQKSVQLTIDVMPGMPVLSADKRACKQMLINVISNAIKFTNPGGTVRVSARASNGAVELVVADNGIGIAAADLSKLGNPFVQASNSCRGGYDGAGLGLSLVKGLARLHGGKFDLASTLGKGTTATITLPLNSNESLEGRLQSRAVSAA
ncbi:MAG TPA: PAS domain-containing sensor histidine kinase [Methyloceanibacter sp.]|nr:PAS domain-containing sensor histidine kinase [Methyloceanibacter sp.]